MVGGVLGLGGLVLLFWFEISGGYVSLIGLVWVLGGMLCFLIGNLLLVVL